MEDKNSTLITYKTLFLYSRFTLRKTLRLVCFVCSLSAYFLRISNFLFSYHAAVCETHCPAVNCYCPFEFSCRHISFKNLNACHIPVLCPLILFQTQPFHFPVFWGHSTYFSLLCNQTFTSFTYWGRQPPTEYHILSPESFFWIRFDVLSLLQRCFIVAVVMALLQCWNPASLSVPFY